MAHPVISEEQNIIGLGLQRLAKVRLDFCSDATCSHLTDFLSHVLKAKGLTKLVCSKGPENRMWR